MSCDPGYVKCAKGCGGCVPADKGEHDDCDPAFSSRSEEDTPSILHRDAEDEPDAKG